MRRLFLLAILSGIPGLAAAQELKLPPGFTATLVTDKLANARHIAIRGNDIYISTNHTQADPGPQAIWAVRMGPDHKAAEVTSFGNVWGGTGSGSTMARSMPPAPPPSGAMRWMTGCGAEGHAAADPRWHAEPQQPQSHHRLR